MGRVVRVGIPGSTTQPASPPTARGGKTQDSEAGPGSPVGAGVGGPGAGRTYGGRGRSCTTLRARSAHPVGLPVQDLADAHLGPIRRDYDLFSLKLVKTTKCHQFMSKRPPVVPIFQNRVQKSPLEKLRFPYSSAFSPKELMGHI